MGERGRDLLANKKSKTSFQTSFIFFLFRLAWRIHNDLMLIRIHFLYDVQCWGAEIISRIRSHSRNYSFNNIDCTVLKSDRRLSRRIKTHFYCHFSCYVLQLQDILKWQYRAGQWHGAGIRVGAGKKKYRAKIKYFWLRNTADTDPDPNFT